MGVTIFEGGGWSSQAQSCLSYVNSNGMLMWSTTSTSPTLAIANDNLFRMCPADSALAPALVDVMWAYGIKTVIIFQRGDSWGDGIVNLFKPAWQAKGGEIAGEVVRYAAESTDFSNYLQQANTMATAAVAKYGTTRRWASSSSPSMRLQSSSHRQGLRSFLRLCASSVVTVQRYL